VLEFQKKGSAVDRGGDLHGSSGNAAVGWNLAKATPAGQDKYSITIHEIGTEWQWNSFQQQADLRAIGEKKRMKVFC
jgi:hypothetical protein